MNDLKVKTDLQELYLPGNRAYLGFFLLSLFVACFVPLVIRDDAKVGYTCAGIIGFMIILFGSSLLPGSYYLKLDRDKLEVCQYYYRETYYWMNIDHFSVLRIKGAGGTSVAGNLILIHLKDQGKLKPLKLYTNFGYNDDALVALLNDWKRKVG